MLARLETAYLYILRVLILIAATLALAVVVLGAVGAMPLLSQYIPVQHQTLSVPGGDLQAFVDEKRSEGLPQTQVDTSSADSNAAPPVPDSIRRAVDLLATYDRDRIRGGLDRASAERAFMDKLDMMPADYQNAYGNSVAKLMDQLVRSKGNPLSLDQINDLINWHAEKFKSAVDDRETKSQASRVAGLAAVAMSGCALLTFFLIVFCFLFVKIERNLRAIHVVDARPTQ